MRLGVINLTHSSLAAIKFAQAAEAQRVRTTGTALQSLAGLEPAQASGTGA